MELSFMYEPPAGVSHRGPGTLDNSQFCSARQTYFLSGPAPLKKKKSEDKGAAKVEKEGWSGKYSILIGQL